MNEKVKIVMVLHKNCPRSFIFEVPEGMNLHRENVVLVDTKYGDAVGVCATEPFEMFSEDIANIEGVTLPLRKIKEFAGKEIQRFIEERLKDDIKIQVKKLLELDDNPF